MLRPRLLRAALPRFGLGQVRREHTLPPMEKFENGIDGLMTPLGFQIAWKDYQQMLVDKINQYTSGSVDDYSNSNVYKLSIKYSRSPAHAALFNHASQAHNNHFFFKCLSNEKTEIPQMLKDNLIASFGSIETLRKEFIAIANAMFGPGYVWLVKKPDTTYALLNTYIAGSPWPAAHFRQQQFDLNTESEVKTPADYQRNLALDSAPPVNASVLRGNKPKIAPGGMALTPILCVSTWQHVYLADWGVLQKKEFLESWWERIDWNIVLGHAGDQRSGPGHLSSR